MIPMIVVEVSIKSEGEGCLQMIWSAIRKDSGKQERVSVVHLALSPLEMAGGYARRAALSFLLMPLWVVVRIHR